LPQPISKQTKIKKVFCFDRTRFVHRYLSSSLFTIIILVRESAWYEKFERGFEWLFQYFISKSSPLFSIINSFLVGHIFYCSQHKKNNYQQKYKDRLKYINAKIRLFLSKALFFDDGGESSLMPEIWDCGIIVQKKASFKGQA